MAQVFILRSDSDSSTVLKQDRQIPWSNVHSSQGYVDVPRSWIQDDGKPVFFYLSVQHETLWAWSPYGAASPTVTLAAYSGAFSDDDGQFSSFYDDDDYADDVDDGDDSDDLLFNDDDGGSATGTSGDDADDNDGSLRRSRRSQQIGQTQYLGVKRL